MLYIFFDTSERRRERIGDIMKTNDKVKCRDCERIILREEAIEYDGGYVCDSCFESDYIVCADCGCIIRAVDSNIVSPGRRTERIVCRSCLRQYSCCSDCGEYIMEDDIWASDYNRTICHDCSSNYHICEDCESVIHQDYAYYSSEDSCYYCQGCFEERSTSYIEEYSYKPYPEFSGESDEGLYLGVELEVDRGSNLYSTTKELCDNFKDIYLKHDGSLTSAGFEIVSHPATLDYHMDELGWKEIMNICKDNDFRSHDTTTCGLHVHLSREFLGGTETEQDLNIAKLIILFDRWWDKYIVPFSRRNVETMERWAAKPSLDYIDTDTEPDIVNKVKWYKSEGRYKAINLQNMNTIEFRLFRGTLKLNTFIASLQFVVVITRFVKSVKLNDIFTAKWSDVFGCTEYEELNQYLKERNLTEEEN